MAIVFLRVLSQISPSLTSVLSHPNNVTGPSKSVAFVLFTSTRWNGQRKPSSLLAHLWASVKKNVLLIAPSEAACPLLNTGDKAGTTSRKVPLSGHHIPYSLFLSVERKEVWPFSHSAHGFSQERCILGLTVHVKGPGGHIGKGNKSTASF